MYHSLKIELCRRVNMHEMSFVASWTRLVKNPLTDGNLRFSRRPTRKMYRKTQIARCDLTFSLGSIDGVFSCRFIVSKQLILERDLSHHIISYWQVIYINFSTELYNILVQKETFFLRLAWILLMHLINEIN